MTAKELIERLTKSFKAETLVSYFSVNCPKFRPVSQNLPELIPEKETLITEIIKIGEAEYDDASRIIFVACKIDKDLTGKESKKAQYELGKKILKQHYYDAGIFVFYGSSNNFRLSLIAASYFGAKREFTTFRRYTYFVSPDFTNKTLVNQLSRCRFSSIEDILEAFSIEAVSEEFYNAFRPKFNEIVLSIKGNDKIDINIKQDFALLFAIRIIFLGFVQKKGWLSSEKFIQNFWNEYKSRKKSDEFYARWLEPLFFEALNSEPGVKVEWGNNDFSKETEKNLQMAPFLNGELFKRKKDTDTLELYLPDKVIGEFFEFLFQYNFTIDENTADDEELELNPEFLGIIFEKFVNKEQGSVYTPRPEVDLMCRLSLLRWLEKKNDFEPIELHHLFFREGGSDKKYEADQKDGNFSENEIRKLLGYLENITVCDPAAGSGAFEVGMLHVINETMEKLYNMPRCPADIEKKTPFERKKAIIARSLYGVEVQGYAVWINQLRLWLTLFIDMPDEMKLSHTPLLPSLNFKIRKGDSLVQRIGNKMFPVQGETALPKPVREKIDELKKEKNDFYYNRGKDEKYIHQLETLVFKKIVDGQIASKQKNLDSIEKPQKQLGLGFGKSEVEQKHLLELANFEKKRNELTAEIEELKAEYQNLSEERPLIWSIEFSEIFYDKNGFDIIIGNPPYVRQEEIADPEGKAKPKEYKELLCEMAVCDYPAYFKNRKINGKSDLYTFFYIRGLHLLNKTGVHCFICSNSWLDVGYGVWLQEFLLENVPVNLIIDNHARRSFSSSDINTIISIFDAPNKNYDRNNHLVKFVAFKKPFDECIFTENLWTIHQAKEITKNDIFRVYPIAAEKLYDEGWETEEGAKKESGEYIGDKWGNKYLRAPDIFFGILEKGQSFITQFSNYFDGERYLNTGGADDFFIINDFCEDGDYFRIFNDKAEGNNASFSGKIEKKFFKPLIKDITKKEKHIIVKEADSLCLVINDKLSKNVTQYIEWGEKNKYHQRSVTKLQRPWFKPTNQMLSGAEIILPRSFNTTFAIHLNPSKYLSLRYYRLHVKKGDAYVLIGYMNTTLFWLLFETLGNKNLGQGVLDFFMADFLKMKVPIVLSTSLKKCIEDIASRPIKNIFVECGIDPKSDVPIEEQEPKPLPDRKELDDIVFDAIGLTEEEKKDVYRAVCRLVWNRISKAKSV
jgi:hypothetical protein